MVLLIPDAVRKIKAQGYAEGYPQGHAEGYAEGQRAERQRIRAAWLEYCRREGIGRHDPIPLSEILNVIHNAIGRNHDDTANRL